MSSGAVRSAFEDALAVAYPGLPLIPLENVQVLLQAIVQVWQPMQRLMLKMKANCWSGYAASYGYSISRPSCQFRTLLIIG